MADKVRLIDAVALEHIIQEQVGKSMIKVFNPSVNLILQDIRNAPTVETEPDKGWVNVKDKLPEPHENVLVFGDFDDIANYRVDYLDNYGRWFRTFYVTHWRPLPKRPKKLSREESDEQLYGGYEEDRKTMIGSNE